MCFISLYSMHTHVWYIIIAFNLCIHNTDKIFLCIAVCFYNKIYANMHKLFDTNIIAKLTDSIYLQ